MHLNSYLGCYWQLSIGQSERGYFLWWKASKCLVSCSRIGPIRRAEEVESDRFAVQGLLKREIQRTVRHAKPWLTVTIDCIAMTTNDASRDRAIIIVAAASPRNWKGAPGCVIVLQMGGGVSHTKSDLDRRKG